MKTLDHIKEGKFYTDDNGLLLFWQPFCDKIIDPKGVIIYRSSNGKPLFFRVMANEKNFKGKMLINDINGDIVLEIKGKTAEVINY